ncbi:MAG: zf-HC2 domain-containing protein [Spirochaetota bacterium]
MEHLSERKISDHIDGALSTSESSRIMRHCEHCVSCRALVDAYRRMNGSIASSVAAPKGYWATFDARLAERLADEKKRIVFPLRVRIPLAIAAALLLTVGIGIPLSMANGTADADMLSIGIGGEEALEPIVTAMDDDERSNFLRRIDEEIAVIRGRRS